MSGRVPFYLKHIPRELKDDAWVCCDQEKVPHILLATGRLRRVSSTDPETWRSYEEAEAALATGRYWDIGRMITAQGPNLGVDLDGCRDPKTRRLVPWAWSIAERLHSYTEVSPSLIGIKTWVKADVAQSKMRASLEIYSGFRYVTTTGALLVDGKVLS
jgi:putative DNA primase/helicase